MHATMKALWEKKKKGPEQKEISLEAKKREVFAGAVLRWVDALRHHPKLQPENFPSLPEAKRLGALFVPTILLSLAVGCDELRTVDCSEGEEAFIKTLVQWLEEHPDEVQTEMDVRWPNATITTQDLVDMMKEATFQCGVDRKLWGDPDLNAFGEAELRSHVVTIDVHEPEFERGLAQYEKGEWLQYYDDIGQLGTIADEYQEAGQGQEFDRMWFEYLQAIALCSGVVEHEVAHLILGRHSEETKERVDELLTEDGSISPEAFNNPPDEIYAWGFSATIAASHWVGETYPKYQQED